jgi:uncharacterized SAM-binding protein YcdF (DUF218 family)
VLREFAEALLAPPVPAFALGVVGALVALRRRKLGLWLCAGAALLLYLLCCPYLMAMALWSLQSHPALPPEGSGEPLPTGAGAVVVLSAGWNPAGPEYAGSTVGALTLERLRYAAVLARRTGLPVLASGGIPKRGEPPLSEMMRDVLVRDFGVEQVWVEGSSADTRTNARESAAILGAAGIERVFLVTHAWHMPRAVAAFRDADLEVIGAPTAFRIRPRLKLRSFWPSARALREGHWALHEWLGRAWYALTG